MTRKNVNLKEMLSLLRNAGLGVIKVDKTENSYKIKFQNGFEGYFNTNDHITRCIRSSKLDKRNKQAREIIEKAIEYDSHILVRF